MCSLMKYSQDLNTNIVRFDLKSSVSVPSAAVPLEMWQLHHGHYRTSRVFCSPSVYLTLECSGRFFMHLITSLKN